MLTAQNPPSLLLHKKLSETRLPLLRKEKCERWNEGKQLYFLKECDNQRASVSKLTYADRMYWRAGKAWRIMCRWLAERVLKHDR
jgi:hypothetical protein